MPDRTNTLEGSAAVHADLWGERARDWADVLEGWSGWGIPLYRHVLERVPAGSGTSLLDVGCGAGRFCRMAADRGAQVAGIDATGPLVEIARERVPDGDFRVGDMEDLPWEDDSFDLVTGFNSFFIAADMVHALREARGPTGGERGDDRLRAAREMPVHGRVQIAAAVRGLAIE